MPGLVEADDDGLYVVKFRGAGPGPEGADRRGRRRRDRPRLRPARAGDRDRRGRPAAGRRRARPGDPGAGRSASGGTNAALDFLPGALPFSPAAPVGVTPELAAEVVWLDALCAERRPHAAQPQHVDLARRPVADRPRRRALPPPRAGVARGRGGGEVPADRATTCCCRSRARSPEAGERLTPRLDPATVERIAAEVPDDWLGGDADAAARRARSTRPTSRSACATARSPPRPRRRAVPPPERASDDAFAYAIWRVVPSVERGEALNVGVVVFCRRRRFLKALVQVDEQRLRALAPDLDVAAVAAAPRRPRPRRRRRPRRRARSPRWTSPTASAS